MVQILAVGYFMAFIAALLKAARYWADYKRHRQGFYLVGVPANLVLALALALIIVDAGTEPLWQGQALVVMIRLSIIGWALLSLTFEILYGRTYLVVTPSQQGEDEENAGQ